jgi:dolichyl-phosphate-mannose-protein mannosyltransferase
MAIREAVPPSRRFLWLTCALSALALLLRAAFLSSQPVSIDDFSVGLTAINYVESGQLGPIMWNHPDLCNILVYYAMRCFGSGVVGLKGMSVLTGTLSVTCIALAGRRLLQSERAALLAALLWALDSLSIDLSRQAVHEIYQSFFPLCAIYLALRYRESGRLWWLVASAFGFGLGLASKWSAAFPLAVTCLLLLWDIWSERGTPLVQRLASSARNAALLVIIPALVYLVTFLPWFGRGYSLAEWLPLQQSMYLETKTHASYKDEVTGDFRPVTWFVRPVAWQDLSFNRSEEGSFSEPSVDENVTVFLALTNPLVWLLVLPALTFTLVRAVRCRDAGLYFLGALFLASYLPLLAASRPIWVNTALSVMPFALLAVGYFLTESLAGAVGRRVLAGYLVAVLLVSAPLYLLATGRGLKTPVLKDYVKNRLYNR